MAQARPREERTASGVLLMALAVTFFTGIDASAKWLILSGLPVLQVVFARYLGHFLYGLALYVPQEGLAVFRSNRPGLQLVRSGFLLSSTIFNFLALSHLPITVTTTIMFASPIVITLLAIPILGEVVGIRRILAVCVGFLGVLVVIQPWGVTFHPAMFYSLAALSTASMYFILTRMLAGIEGNSTQQIWSSGVAALALAPFVLEGWIWPDKPLVWLMFFVIGLLGLLGHLSATIAHRWADASILSPVFYIQVVQAAAVGIVVFGQWPTLWTLAGAAIIICSGLYIWQRERRIKA